MDDQIERMTDEVFKSLKIHVYSDLGRIKKPEFSDILRLILLNVHKLDIRMERKERVR